MLSANTTGRASPPRAAWDVAVIGAGPAGLAAATACAAAGARTIILERARHPRYKTCGGGLIGASLAAVGGDVHLPVRDRINTATFTLRGRHEFTRQHEAPILSMVLREEFDDALRQQAMDAGAALRERSPVRAISQEAEMANVRLADGTTVTAKVVVGADGSSGVSARYVGVEFSQVDLGLEVEIKAPAPVQRRWQGRLLLDWGKMPGSYGWVFPKEDRLTVGVIAARGQGQGTREYLREFVDRLKLGSGEVLRDSGHLTRCRTSRAKLRERRVLVAGDAAGLLEPWTREGISFALRSGSLAGAFAAKAALTDGQEQPDSSLEEYVSSLHRDLIPEMQAGRLLLAAFARHPRAFHAGLATPPGWRAFVSLCRSETSFSSIVNRRPARLALSLLAKA
ncbi:MAG TPA: geranylgeranyl reductase family protein [Streptosporangiaceae bacterium]|nr:geranylgeranyl reductase family protein [Streptosporangiaceae bacterium]